MADHSKPTTTSTYVNFVSELDGRLDDISLGLDPATTSPTNLATNAIRWTSASNKWQKYNGTTWADLSSAYSININGTVGATTPASGAFTTLSATGNVTLGDASGDTVTINGTVGAGVVISGSTATDALRITQTGAGNALVVEDSTNPDSSPFVVDASGAVGIGTSSPSVKLNVVSGATSGAIDDAAIFSGGVAGVSGSGSAIYLTGGGGVARAAAITGVNTSGASNAHAMVFSTSANSAAPTERMRIDSAGNVGIGGTPSYKLDVQQSGNLNATIGISNTTAGTSSVARLIAISDAGNASFGFTSSSYTDITGAADALLLNASNASGGMAFALDGVVKMKMDSSGRVGIGTTSPAVKLAVSSTDAILVPVGTTAQRPTGATGYIRYNTSTSSFEGHNGTAWGNIGGGATGGGTDTVFYLNSQAVSTTYSIPSGQNASCVGPITVSSGATVTVPSGSRWVVL